MILFCCDIYFPSMFTHTRDTSISVVILIFFLHLGYCPLCKQDCFPQYFVCRRPLTSFSLPSLGARAALAAARTSVAAVATTAARAHPRTDNRPLPNPARPPPPPPPPLLNHGAPPARQATARAGDVGRRAHGHPKTDAPSPRRRGRGQSPRIKRGGLALKTKGQSLRTEGQGRGTEGHDHVLVTGGTEGDAVEAGTAGEITGKVSSDDCCCSVRKCPYYVRRLLIYPSLTSAHTTPGNCFFIIHLR